METRLISIHQVRFMPLVEMMITELSTPLASNKCRPLPVVGWRLWMTDFSSDPLLEAKAVISFCCGMVQASQCREVPPCFFFPPPPHLRREHFNQRVAFVQDGA